MEEEDMKREIQEAMKKLESKINSPVDE